MTGEPRTRTPNRWGEGARLRDDILAAAARLLAESGREESLSLRAVAREVGIAPPSVYLHFKDRGDLVATVMRGAYGALAAELRHAARQGPGDDPVGALRVMGRAYCRFVLDNPRRYRLMFGVEQIEIPRDRMAGHPVHEVIAVWRAAVEACPRPGGGLPAERRAVLLWAGLHGVVGLWTAMPMAPDLDSMNRVADDLVTTILAG